MRKITVTDDFWNKRVSLVRDVIVPYQWDALNDNVSGAEKSGAIHNFEVAAGVKEGKFRGLIFQDSDLAKWIEAAAYALKDAPDTELEKKIDYVVSLIGKAQWDDGYINTCTTLTGKEMRWKNLLERHELYIAGHLMEAAAAYRETAGKTEFLDIMRKFADLICDTFGRGEGQIRGYPGHQEIELGLIKMYGATGERKYLETAKYFIDERGTGENYFQKEITYGDFPVVWKNKAEPAYNQSHLPVREQKTAEGHSVRALYMYSAMAELAKETGDITLAAACETLWDNITEKRMYITGGAGSSANGERFTADYDLPNDSAYAESCASVALFMFGERMNKLTHDAKYIDAAENALLNTVSAGISLDGKSFFYVNPLEVEPRVITPATQLTHVKTARQKWFGCACCPPNIARLFASIYKYIYVYENDTLYVNLFIANRAEFSGLKAELKAGFPENYGFTLEIETEKETRLALRMPFYAENYSVKLNGAAAGYEIEKGYAVLNAEGKAKIEVSYGAPPKFIWTNPAVGRNNGRIAVRRGPLVYCFEQADNGTGIASFFADTGAEIEEEWDGRLGVWKIKLRGVFYDGWSGGLYSDKKPAGRGASLAGVPYAVWNNRGEGEMYVWLRYLNRGE